MTRRILTYLLASSALMMAACSSDNVIEEVKPIVEPQDPMRFSNVSDNYQTRTDYSIPNLLKQGFMVSCYKKFGEAGQQEVMPQYEVNYEQYDSWYGETVSWNYISAESSHQFYQEQFEKYWDASAYPYRFHAVSPAPLTASNALTPGFTLTDMLLKVPTPFQYQTSCDGSTTPTDAVAEPCMVAQVERNNEGHDFDLLAQNTDKTGPKEINDSKGLSKIRSVALPFHHLNAKVRFAIYCPDLGEECDGHEVFDVKIKVRSSQFVTSAQYQADLTQGSLMGGQFHSPAYDGTTLLELTPDAVLHNNDLVDANSREKAYFFECPLGLAQIPQDGVQLSVSMKIVGKLEDDQWHDKFMDEYTVIEDLPIVLNDETHQDTYNWEMNHFYTYYIIIGRFTTPIPQYPIVDGSKGILFTCVETPWDEITGAPIDISLQN